MKKRKISKTKIGILFITVFSIICLSACGKESSSKQIPDTDTKKIETKKKSVKLSELIEGERRIWFDIDNELSYNNRVRQIYITENGKLVEFYYPNKSFDFEDIANFTTEKELKDFFIQEEITSEKITDNKIELELRRTDSGNDVEEESLVFSTDKGGIYHLESQIEETTLLENKYIGFNSGYHGGCCFVTLSDFSNDGVIQYDTLNDAKDNPLFEVY